MKLLLLLGFILPISLFAQGDFRPGYIIKNNGDSVVGFVDYRSEKSNSESCYFRVTQNQEVMRFSPSEISAYGFISDKRYESRNPKGDSTASREVFMECIVRGPMSLYRLEGVFYIETGSLVKLPPKASKIVHTKAGTMHGTDNTYIGLLNHAIFSCKLTANNIDYNERHITNLVQNYNRCKGREGTVYKGVKPFTRYSMYVSGGVDISKLTIDGLSNNVFKASSSPLIGLGVDISSPRLNDRLFLTLGAFYLEKEYVGYEEEISYNTRRSDYLIPISFLKFPVGCRYNFFHESKTPYVKIGIVQFIVLESSIEVLDEYEAAGVVTTEFTTSELDARNQMGFWFAAGFSKTIRNRIKGFAEVRYERGNGFLGPQFLGDAPSATANVNVLIGLSF